MGEFLTHNAKFVARFRADMQVEPLHGKCPLPSYLQRQWFYEKMLLFSRNKLIIPGREPDVEIWPTFQKVFYPFWCKSFMSDW